MAFHDSSVVFRFRNAVETLATGVECLQKRLRDAYDQLIPIPEDALPVELQDQLASIHVYMTRKEAKGDEGTASATAALLPDEHAREIAKTIFALSYKLENWGDES